MDKGVILKNKGYSSRTLFTTYGKISYKRTLLAPFDKDSAIALAKLGNDAGVFGAARMLLY